jgi:PAS domain-containing protein
LHAIILTRRLPRIVHLPAWNAKSRPSPMTEDRVMSNTGELQQVSSGSHGSGRLFDDQYQSVFRAAPIGIGLTRNRILLQVNQRLCQMTGYRREELVGQSARILYPDTAEFERV